MDTLEHAPEDRVELAPRFASGATVGHFRIIRELGAGGMGVVYEAHDPDLDRRVAIKVVRDRDAGSAAGARLIREAKAMARLAHPNVVAVYEVGTIETQVFLVMELVRGETLAAWLETPRPWRALVDAFAQAADGLGAAHRAGLIHRDFKPTNVLIDDHGRVRVSDFGLARDDGDDQPRFALGSDPARVAGTPAYMAPEQRAGKPIDARADQYAYAISLQQALSPEHVIGTPPPRVRNVIMRALAIEPSARFATVDELAAELRRGLRSRTRIALVAAAVIASAAIAGSAVALIQPSAASDDCELGIGLVDQVWSATTRDAQAARFAAVRPTAGAVIATTGSALDDWADRWRLGRRAACRVESTLRSARIACLDAGVDELRAQLAAWVYPDPAMVDLALNAALAIPDPSACVHRTSTPAPASWVTKPIFDRSFAMRAAYRAGQAMTVKPLGAALLADANASGDPALQAHALLSVAMIKYETGNLTEARDDFAASAVAAGRAGDDQTMVDALIDDAIAVTDVGRPLDALGMLDAAAAVSARAGIDEEAQVETVRGNALVEAGRSADGILALQRAIAILEPRAGRDVKSDMDLATTIGILGSAHTKLYEFDQAVPLHRRAIAIVEKRVGPTHPEIGKMLADLAEAEAHSGHLDDGLAHITRAHDLMVAAYGADSVQAAETDISRATVIAHTGKVDEALALYLHVNDVLSKKLPADHNVFVSIESGIVDIEVGRNRCGSAIPHLERMIVLLEHRNAGGALHAIQLTTLAECLVSLDRYADAETAEIRAVSELEGTTMHVPELAEARLTLADIEDKLGHRARAIELARAMLAATTDVTGQFAQQIAAMRAHVQDKLATWSKSPASRR